MPMNQQMVWLTMRVGTLLWILGMPPVYAQSSDMAPLPQAGSAPISEPTSDPGPEPAGSHDVPPDIDLPSEMIEGSPVLQRWLDDIPNVQSDIRTDPAFRTRVRLGYVQFPATDDSAGLGIGIEDVFLGRTGLTVSGDYQQTVEGDRQSYGAELRYYLLPLGDTVNLAPVVGYRHLETDDYTSEGLNVGLRLMLALSRTGAADMALSQTWVAPGTDDEVSITGLSAGYALTSNLRLSTDLQWHSTAGDTDERFGLMVEWMP